MNNSEYGTSYYNRARLNLLFVLSALLLLIAIALVTWFDYSREWKFWQRKYINIEIKKKSFNSGHHYLRNLPIIDLFNPSLRIRQVVVDDITRGDNQFAKIPTIDRCTTCHISVDQKEYASETQPLKTHPRLDLFVSSTSPHPFETFGCTICHRGRGQATTFLSAAHAPADKKQNREWKKRYKWEKLKNWEEPMLPLPYTEASCLKCHMDSLNKIGAKKLQAGANLIKKLTCNGCHTIPGSKSEYKMAPSLLRVSAKFTKEKLLKKIVAPKLFNANSKMPQFFPLVRSTSESEKLRYVSEASAIRDYLYSLSLPETGKDHVNMLTGSEVRGELLYKSMGCVGCHDMERYTNKNEKGTLSHGPDLSKIGSKVKPEWLFGWLKNPTEYSEKTLMPNFILSDNDALDISAFLMSRKDNTLDNWKLEESAGKTNSLENNQVGKNLILNYGCYGCHEIKGFEKNQPSAPDLTKVGSKYTGHFDFSGFGNSEKTREQWLFKKVLTPSDFGSSSSKVRQRLFMPSYNLTRNEGEAIVTYLMALTDENIPAKKKLYLSNAESILESGRRVVEKYNCTGCHLIEKNDTEIHSPLLSKLIQSGLKKEEATLILPPSLEGEGEKVKSQWLLNFLKEPYSLRPWLSTRMPKFSLSDQERIALVEYFNLLSGRDFNLDLEPDEKSDGTIIATGEKIIDLLKCKSCHPLEAAKLADMDKNKILDFAPNLSVAGERLRSAWIVKWLKDPQKVKKGTRMPTYWITVKRGEKNYYIVPPSLKKIMDGNGDEHIKAITAYLSNKASLN